METTGAKVVLITGAAGGLGQALTQQFARQGWRVAAGFHQTAIPSGPENILPVPLDVTNTGHAPQAVSAILARWGRMDALINNAGVTADEILPQMSDAAWDQVLDVNLKGAFRCAQAAVRPMMKQRDGHILNISSFGGRAGARGQINYAAAKAGLLGLTTALAKEAGSRNVRVNAVLPGALPTRMTASLGEGRLAELRAANALGRLNSLEEVARFIVFLTGTQNISGQLFQLDSRIAPWT